MNNCDENKDVLNEENESNILFAKALEYENSSDNVDANELINMFNDSGVNVNVAKNMMFNYYIKQAETSSEPSLLFKIARCYELGNGCRPNAEIALSFYKRCANDGHKLAQYLCYLCHITGEGTSIKIKIANEYLENCDFKNEITEEIDFDWLSSKFKMYGNFDFLHNYYILFKLGDIYDDNLEFGKYNRDKLLDFCEPYVKISKRNKTKDEYTILCLNKMRFMLYKRACDVPWRNYHIPLKYSNRDGSFKSNYLYKIGEFYEHGLGTKIYVKSAFKWYKNAYSEYDDNDNVVYKFLTCYEFGIGVKKDIDKAIEISYRLETLSSKYLFDFHKRLQQNEVAYKNFSLLKVANYYMNGIGCILDTNKGIDIYTNLAISGDRNACKKLYEIYSKGDNLNYIHALYWLDKCDKKYIVTANLKSKKKLMNKLNKSINISDNDNDDYSDYFMKYFFRNEIQKVINSCVTYIGDIQDIILDYVD